jgi:hypothetical protein
VASEAVSSAWGSERRVRKEHGSSNVAAQDRKMQGRNEVVEILDEDSAEQLRYSLNIELYVPERSFACLGENAHILCKEHILYREHILLLKRVPGCSVSIRL